MEYKEIKNKSEAELHRLLSEMRNKLRDLRFKDANKQLKDVRDIRETRKVISRVLTMMNSNKKEKQNSEKKVAKDTEKK